VAIPGEHHANLALSPNEKYVFGTIANSAAGSDQSGAIYRTLNPAAE
jgi:gluconolactonase